MAYMLDTNIFNRVLDGRFDLSTLPGHDYRATPVQYEELKACQDQARRASLLEVFQQIAPEIEPAAFALDVAGAGLDEGVFRERETASAVLSDLDATRKKDNNAADSVIAEAALYGGHVLVTADRRLGEVATRHGIAVHQVS